MTIIGMKCFDFFTTSFKMDFNYKGKNSIYLPPYIGFDSSRVDS